MRQLEPHRHSRRQHTHRLHLFARASVTLTACSILLASLCLFGSAVPVRAASWSFWNHTGDASHAGFGAVHADVAAPETPLRRFLKAVKAYPSSRTPTAAGVCSSVRAPRLPAGLPRMTSSWYLTRFLTGQQIQLKASTWGTWVVAPRLGRPGMTLALQAFQPTGANHFKVVVAGTNQIRLATLSGAYLSATRSSLTTTANRQLPSTLFTVSRSGAHWFLYSPAVKAYVSTTKAGRLGAFGSAANAYERFRVVEAKEIAAIRGVNLGSWLVYEHWMDPNAFPAVTGLMDGMRVAFQNRITRNYVTFVGTTLLCTAPMAGETESMVVQTVQPGGLTYMFLSPLKLYVNLAPGSSQVTAQKTTGSAQTKWVVMFNPSDANQVVIRAPNGKYLEASSSGMLTATGNPSLVNLGDPATFSSTMAFNVEILKTLRYDWQLAYNWQSQRVAKINQIRRSFITEADWRYMAKEKINAVRIPVPYYLAQGNRPDYPFVPGVLTHLDWAFRMAAKYGVRIFFSMHMVAGSQSGTFGSRLGFTDFGLPGNARKTLMAVQMLAQRYGRSPWWLGMGLMNEPGKGVGIELLKKYYELAYVVIRRSSPCAFLAMEGFSSPWDIMDTVNEPNTMVEAHFYDVFNGMGFDSAQEEVFYIKANRARDIKSYQKFHRPLLIGEFSNAMAFRGPAPSQQQEFSLAQMQVYGQAKAGWFFWSLKLNKPGDVHWNWRLSSARGWLPKRPNGNWY